jgi:hypothetical protein
METQKRKRHRSATAKRLLRKMRREGIGHTFHYSEEFLKYKVRSLLKTGRYTKRQLYNMDLTLWRDGVPSDLIQKGKLIYIKLSKLIFTYKRRLLGYLRLKLPLTIK